MTDNTLAELESIKKLLLLLLIKLGTTSDEIGAALDMHPGNVRKIISGSKIKKLDFVRNH